MFGGRLGKTPTQYSGIKPDSWNIEELLNKWSTKEKIEYLTYFERDSIVFGITIGVFVGTALGIVLGVFYALYWL